MYFVDRLQLGSTMAQRLIDLKGKEPIILCLKESSLSTSIALASELRGWIYPLLAERVVIPGDPRIIGVINQEGTLCYNPELSKYEREELEMEYSGVIQDATRAAFHQINQASSIYGELNKAAFNGRTVLLCADILRDHLEVSAANELLKSAYNATIVGVIGNIDVNVADDISRMSERSSFMDVMSNMFDDQHYYEQPEAYTLDEQRSIAMNIATYWK